MKFIDNLAKEKIGESVLVWIASTLAMENSDDSGVISKESSQEVKTPDIKEKPKILEGYQVDIEDGPLSLVVDPSNLSSAPQNGAP